MTSPERVEVLVSKIIVLDETREECHCNEHFSYEFFFQRTCTFLSFFLFVRLVRKEEKNSSNEFLHAIERPEKEEKKMNFDQTIQSDYN